MYSARNLHDDTAGPFERATIHENFKPGVEHHRMHEITPQPTPLPAMDPQFDGLAVEHHRMHEISSPSKSFPAMDSHYDQPVGSSMAPVHESTKPPIETLPPVSLPAMDSQFDQPAESSMAETQGNNSWMKNLLELSYVTNPPQFDQPAESSMAPVHESTKPPIEIQPSASLPAMDSRIDQPAGLAVARINKNPEPRYPLRGDKLDWMRLINEDNPVKG